MIAPALGDAVGGGAAAPIAAASGGPAWLLRGPVSAVPDTDAWTAIEASLRSRPDAPRLRAEGVELTGGALIDAVAGLSLPSGGLIGVHVGRSAALVIAILAVWRSGSAYVPLAPELPAARLRRMVDDLAPAAIITDDADAGFPDHRTTAILVVAGRTLHLRTRRPDAGGSADRRERPAPPPPCYVPHTSGTTGPPKAIAVPHRALLNRMAAMRRIVAPAAGDVVLFKTSLAFDVHVWEFAFPLLAGCLLVVHGQERHFDPRAVARLVVREGVTIAGFVPALLGVLLDQAEFVAGNRLRLLFCGGEGWGVPLARKLRERLPGCRMRNSYGPAETTLAVANWPVPADPTAIEIGSPLDNTLFLVEATEQVGSRVTGVLSIGGAQVADGYLSQAGSEVGPGGFFTHSVDGAPTAFYRTGDLVDLDVASGALVYRGRLDGQVKLNGVRIELEEIETAILTLAEVEASVVTLVPRGDRSFLLATFKPRTGSAVASAAVRQRCEALLPRTHVPTMFRAVDHYALGPTGKVDRNRVRDAVASELSG